MTSSDDSQPLRRVLVATDFSQGAMAALDRALALPLAVGARVDLVHVLHVDDSHSTEARAREKLAGEVDRASTRTTERRVELVTSCLRGQAFVEIIRTARQREAELIVVGAHGVHSLRDRLIGSTAARVVRMGDVPVLLVRRPAAAPYQNVLVALALGDTDRRILDLARQVAPGPAKRAVTHAVHVPYEGFLAPSSTARDDLRRAYCDEAIARLRGVLAEHGRGAHWTTSVSAGDIRGVILEDTARRDADLLVAGTHGRSGIAHALIGSVAETLIESAPCDVLVARPTRFTFELP